MQCVTARASDSCLMLDYVRVINSRFIIIIIIIIDTDHRKQKRLRGIKKGKRCCCNGNLR